MHDVWRNQFLFWAIMAGFITVFPVLYIPVINHVVFKHTGISWEWAIVLIEAILFFAGIETWKWGKRIFFRRRAAKLAAAGGGDLQRNMFSQFLTMSESPSQEKAAEQGRAGAGQQQQQVEMQGQRIEQAQ
jgi:Na+-exporting ATPase